RALGEEADVVALLMRRTLRPAADQRLARQLRQQGVELILIQGGEPDRPGLPRRVVEPVAAGTDVRGQRIRYQGRAALAEGRALGDGDGVVLVASRTGGVGRQVWQRLWLALLAGLAAGAAAGALLAGRLARPIRD